VCDDETPAPAAQVSAACRRDTDQPSSVGGFFSLGIFDDGDLVMRTRVQKTVSRCFAVLRQLRSIRRLVPATTFQTPGLPAYLFPASSVGDERGSTAHLRPASLRPHLRRTQQPPMAPRSGEGTIQDGCAHVQGHSWNCAVIHESTGSFRTNRQVVPSVKLSTVGSRAFPVAGPTIWNRLPNNVISARPSLCRPSVSI